MTKASTPVHSVCSTAFLDRQSTVTSHVWRQLARQEGSGCFSINHGSTRNISRSAQIVINLLVPHQREYGILIRISK
jgi:hypothetical protein